MTAEVRLWGRTIGAVSMVEGRDYAAFEYTDDFARSGIEVSPIVAPLGDRVFVFPELSRATFHGLPGLLADSLPDRFGNALINAWLASQGREPDSFNSVERLCYTATRGMGALEFAPSSGPRTIKSFKIDVGALVELASQVLSGREQLTGTFSESSRKSALSDILRVGTSAGGARAKAVVAWNRQTNEVRSGQVAAEEGFEHWLLKFDGVTGNKDKELEDPKGYGDIEYAYHLMARAAGIGMTECRLLEENGRRHFMTKRFDRLDGGGKLHLQSLGALAHLDFNQPGSSSYEQALLVMRQLALPAPDIEQQFRRMVFNIVARNQDDHVKNIAFLMDRQGRWSLSPAFDVTYSYNSSGVRTATHQMSMNGKRDGFSLEDFRECGKAALLKRGRAEALVAEVTAVVTRWPEFASRAQISPTWLEQIRQAHRLAFPAT